MPTSSSNPVHPGRQTAIPAGSQSSRPNLAPRPAGPKRRHGSSRSRHLEVRCATPPTSTGPAAQKSTRSVSNKRFFRGLHADVSMSDFKFHPATIYVNVGTTITWSFRRDAKDNEKHKIVWQRNSDSDTRGLKDSIEMHAGQTFRLTFTCAGEFNYHCAVCNLLGRVVVRPTQTPSPPADLLTPTQQIAHRQQQLKQQEQQQHQEQKSKRPQQQEQNTAPLGPLCSNENRTGETNPRTVATKTTHAPHPHNPPPPPLSSSTHSPTSARSVSRPAKKKNTKKKKKKKKMQAPDQFPSTLIVDKSRRAASPASMTSSSSSDTGTHILDPRRGLDTRKNRRGFKNGAGSVGSSTVSEEKIFKKVSDEMSPIIQSAGLGGPSRRGIVAAAGGAGMTVSPSSSSCASDRKTRVVQGRNSKPGPRGRSRSGSAADVTLDHNRVVKINLFTFNPQTITVTQGQSVRWVVEDKKFMHCLEGKDKKRKGSNGAGGNKSNTSGGGAGGGGRKEKDWNKLKDWQSETFGHGGSYEHVFSRVGNFEYRCREYPWMNGNVEVVSKGFRHVSVSTTTECSSAVTTNAKVRHADTAAEIRIRNTVISGANDRQWSSSSNSSRGRNNNQDDDENDGREQQARVVGVTNERGGKSKVAARVVSVGFGDHKEERKEEDGGDDDDDDVEEKARILQEEEEEIAMNQQMRKHLRSRGRVQAPSSTTSSSAAPVDSALDSAARAVTPTLKSAGQSVVSVNATAANNDALVHIAGGDGDTKVGKKNKSKKKKNKKKNTNRNETPQALEQQHQQENSNNRGGGHAEGNQVDRVSVEREPQAKVVHVPVHNSITPQQEQQQPQVQTFRNEPPQQQQPQQRQQHQKMYQLEQQHQPTQQQHHQPPQQQQQQQQPKYSQQYVQQQRYQQQQQRHPQCHQQYPQQNYHQQQQQQQQQQHGHQQQYHQQHQQQHHQSQIEQHQHQQQQQQFEASEGQHECEVGQPENACSAVSGWPVLVPQCFVDLAEQEWEGFSKFTRLMDERSQRLDVKLASGQACELV